MARRYEWPDPKDRSPNNPHTLLEREAVVDLYRQGTSPVGWARFCAHHIGECWNAGCLATQHNRQRQTAKHRRTQSRTASPLIGWGGFFKRFINRGK